MTSTKSNPVDTLTEKIALINKLTDAIVQTNSVVPDSVESASIYGGEYRIDLRGDDSTKRSFTFELLRRLRVARLKRNLEYPSQLSYTFELEAMDRWSEKHLTFTLCVSNFPAAFKTECKKTCYAVYEDGRRIPIVKAGEVGASDFNTSVAQL